MGLFSAPAVIRLPDCASTPVMSPVAAGQRADRASRVTCCEANVSNLPTEICGLFLIAIASACFSVRLVGPPGVTWGARGYRLLSCGHFVDALGRISLGHGCRREG